jgi:hypothetical protein
MDIREDAEYNPLERQFEEVLQNNQIDSVNINGYNNYIISTALHKYVYRKPKEQISPTPIRAKYYDGSYGDPFSLRCLPWHNKIYEPPLRDTPPLRVAMISMRHHNLDQHIDYNWILNKDIPQNTSYAHIEEFSYIQTRQQLQEGLHEGCLKLHFYLTGFQPVAIGFYRALIDELQARTSQKPVLEVVPYYYLPRMKCYCSGKIWN